MAVSFESHVPHPLDKFLDPLLSASVLTLFNKLQKMIIFTYLLKTSYTKCGKIVVTELNGAGLLKLSVVSCMD